jgi:hypothetical protein
MIDDECEVCFGLLLSVMIAKNKKMRLPEDGKLEEKLLPPARSGRKVQVPLAKVQVQVPSLFES